MRVSNSLARTTAAFAYPLWRHQRINCLYAGIAWFLISGSAYSLSTFDSSHAVSRILQYIIGGSLLAVFFMWSTTTSGILSPTLARRDGLCIQSLFVLPIRTEDLVLAPMFICILIAVLPCLLFWVAVVVPLGFNIPILLPLLLLTLVVTSTHAGNWLTASKSKAGRLLSIVAGAPILIVFGWIKQMPEPALCVLAFALIGLSVYASLEFAPFVRHSIARHRNSTAARTSSAKPSVELIPNEPPLQGPLNTQIWYESVRKLYVVMPILTGMGAVSLLCFKLFSSNSKMTSLVGDIGVSSSAGEFFMLVPLVLLGAFLFASNSRIQNVTANPQSLKDSALELFVAIRPISTSSIVGSKLRINIRGALLTSGVVLIGFFLWSLLPAQSPSEHGTILGLLLTHARPRLWRFIGLSTISLPFLIWSNLAGEPFQAILGSSKNIAKYGPYVLTISTIIIAIGFMVATSGLPIQDVTRTEGAFASVGVGIWLLLKVGFAAGGMVRLRQKNLVNGWSLAQGGATWVIAAVILTTAYYLVFPPGRIPVTNVLTTIVLLLPANRILWQILSLDAKRHQ